MTAPSSRQSGERDLIERLRAGTYSNDDGSVDVLRTEAEMDEAADEIEKLRRLLQETVHAWKETCEVNQHLRSQLSDMERERDHLQETLENLYYGTALGNEERQ